MGLVVTQRVEPSWTRDQTHVPCLGRWILYHWIPYMHFNGFYLLFAIYQALYKYLISSSCNLTTPDKISILQKRELKLREAETLSCYSLSSKAAFQPDHIWPQSLCSSPLACVGRTGQPGGAFPTRQPLDLVISMGPGSKANGAIRGGGLCTKWHSERGWRASTERSAEPQPPPSWTACDYTRPCTQPWRHPAPRPGTLPDCPQGHCNRPQSPEFHPPSSPPPPVVLCLCCCIMPLKWAHLSDQVDHKYLKVRVHTSIFWLLHPSP